MSGRAPTPTVDSVPRSAAFTNATVPLAVFGFAWIASATTSSRSKFRDGPVSCR